MKYSTIRIEGSILSPDILDKIEQGDISGQRPEEFGLKASFKVKDEIARAWANAHDLWNVFCRQRERINTGSGTSETRKYWMLPLLDFLGYDAELVRAEEINGKCYAISHRVKDRDGFPIHIMGFRDSLDRRREDSGPRMSPHALVQEYINVTEHLYGIVTNGLLLRLIRDSSRLVKFSYIEFDFQAMMEEEQFADFAIMYRILHASRMPASIVASSECLIEKYHQDSLDAGSRIREGLSDAVETSIKAFAEGFLNHEANGELRQQIGDRRIFDHEFYQWHLRLIYRLLFLMVIEERKIIYPKDADQRKVGIYYDFYSVGRLRALCEKVAATEKGYCDLWISLRNTFRVFEKEYFGKSLEVKPLAGELFHAGAIGLLNECSLDNTVLLQCLKNLSVFTNKNNNQKMRVNYASLNVEEFGSVYEGLLEYDPVVEKPNGYWHFIFRKGEGRASSGSHYTPEELVQPLIKHSLEYIIEEKLRDHDKQKALLSIKVCDVACGSGHILLSAARRIAVEVARVRTGEDQPSPEAFRLAVRDVIRYCIYGVDKNPLAVELCKVGLWLEAHNPGAPLNFLDHHIKCGDAVVGLAHKEELENGIAEEAFKRLPDDDKDVCAALRKQNKNERSQQLTKSDFFEKVGGAITDVNRLFKDFDLLPEDSPEQIATKKKAYDRMTSGSNWWRLKTLADVQVAQFFIPKDKTHKEKITTDGQYRSYLAGAPLQGRPAVHYAESVGVEKRFFHWFLEFPEVFAEGGFDCVLGNPPFLGGQRLSGAFGNNYLNYLKTAFFPAGAIDFVGFFFRRNFTIIRKNGFLSLISTNTIAQGDTREGALDVIERNGGSINFAIRSIRWPGVAAVNVSLLSINKGGRKTPYVLDGKKCERISTYLDDGEALGDPFPLKSNEGKSFQGSIVLGKGFVLTPEEVQELIEKNPKNKDVLFPYLNGDDLNSRSDQSPSRWVINFFDWEEDYCRSNYPECFSIIKRTVKSQRATDNRDYYRKNWWKFAERRTGLYRTIAGMDRVLVMTRVTKYAKPIFVSNGTVFSEQIVIFAFEDAYIWAIIDSEIHEQWAWRYCSTMGASTIRYSPSDIFITFPFPKNIPSTLSSQGEECLKLQKEICENLRIGLTKLLNLFHIDELKTNHFEKEFACLSSEKYLTDIQKLRKLHKNIDELIISSYGWSDIDLRHDFYEVDYLPENDRIRYTIHPDARKEILKRLLKLNHERHEEEVKAGLWDKGRKSKTKEPK
ncbi:MAG: N-6 DNA methylase, partial [Candidatus Aminicenantes bacterium]|nr:N-6 DNA methylase [Candidatus Aminicenantes bacterium]